MSVSGSLCEFQLSAAKCMKLPVCFQYASSSSPNVTGLCQLALVVLTIQTDGPFNEALRVLHEMRCV
jgi:hypothetical protein